MIRSFASRLVQLATLIAIAVLGVAEPVTAQSVESFYKGKQLKFMLSTSLSGGYATYARVISPYMEKYLPGKPSFILQNMPGAGGIVAANWLANAAPKDGSVVAMIHRGAVSNQPLFGAKNVRYDATKFGWIGSMNSDISVCVAWHTAPVKSFADLKTTPSIFGGVGAGSDIDAYPTMLNNLFDTKIRLITGYNIGNNIHIAMERGEVHGRCGWSVSSLLATAGPWVKEKKINLLVQIGMTKHAAIPDVPWIFDQTTDPELKEVMETIAAPLFMGRPLLTSPGVPTERLAALRESFDQAMADPGFKAEADKRKLEYDHVPGKQVEDVITRIYAMPKPIIEKAKEALSRTDKIQITKKEPVSKVVKSALTAVKPRGREISFKDGNETHSTTLSGSRSKVTVGGKPAKREELKAGMSCSITYGGDKTEASLVACD